MNYRAVVNWASLQPQVQLDWVDLVISVEEWLEEYVGTKGSDWDWLDHTGCSQVGFDREQDCQWFQLRWS